MQNYSVISEIELNWRNANNRNLNQESCRSGRTGLTRNQVSAIGGPGVRIPRFPLSPAEVPVWTASRNAANYP